MLGRNGALCIGRSRTTTPNATRKGTPRSQTSSTHTAAAVGTHTCTDDTKNKPVGNFDDGFDKGFTFYVVEIQQGPSARDRFINAGSPERLFTRSLQKGLGIAEKHSFQNR